MDFASIGQPVPFDDLPGGACFVFVFSGGVQVGFKAVNAKAVPRETRLILLPAGRSEARAISTAELSNPMLHLPDAKMVPTTPLAFFPGTDFRDELGALVVHGSGVYLSFANATGTWLANVATGEAQRSLDDEDFVWTREWKIFAKFLDRDECIFTAQAPKT